MVFVIYHDDWVIKMLHYSSDFILQNMFVQITYVAERKCTPDWKLQGKTIYDRHNLILVYDGEAKLTCNDRTYHVTKGNLIYYRPGDFRLGTTPPENLMKCFTVDFFYTHPVLSEYTWSLAGTPLPFSTVETIHDQFLYSRLSALFSTFVKTWFFSDYNRIIRAKAIFMDILSLLLHWKTNDNFNFDHIRKIEKLISFMSDNYCAKITLQELAKQIHISPTYLESIFKSITGKSPINYLISIRIQKAKELLLDGHKISEVASKVGFSDVFYFSKCFKKCEGVSPSHFLNFKNNI